MLKDVTIGQYFPGNSPLHRMDSRVKIILDLVFIVMLFSAQNAAALGLSCAYAAFSMLLSGISLGAFVKGIKPILPLLAFTAVLNIFFAEGKTVLCDFGFFKIYLDAVENTAFVLTRIIALIFGMSLLTYTTSPISLTDGIESLLSPLKRIRFPAHELAMMMTIALRFIPILLEETDKIMSAQKARGANLDSGTLMQRARALIPVLIPLFVCAFKHANELATAMECRCYTGGEGRTRMKQMRTTFVDVAALLVTVVFLAAVVAVPFINFGDFRAAL